MISIAEIPEFDASLDPFEDGLMLPIPKRDRNSIVLEQRDGTNVQRIRATGAELSHNGQTVFKLSGVKIDVFVTDARVAFACSKYDKGGGWVAGRVVVDQETLIADKEGVEIVDDQVVGELGWELIGFGLLFDGLDLYPA